MTRLAHRLGLSPNLGFHEPYSLTEPELIALVPRPVYAMLFLYPEHSLQEDHDRPTLYDGSGPDEPVLWFRQIIGNACGMIGLLHCMTNGEASKHIIPGSDLDKLVQEAIPLKPTERANLLNDSDMLEKAHKEAAQTGDSRAPLAEDPVDYAFTAFVKGKDNHLYLMEGWKKGPIDRGELAEDEDLFSPKALELGPLAVINQTKASEGRFSCVVLTENYD